MIAPPIDPDGGEVDSRPSKSQRKRDMHELQALGDALVALRADQLSAFALPELLLEAILAAQKISKHEGRRRQLQYVGRLMREVDPLPIRARLEELARGPRADASRHRLAEDWRARLLTGGDAALTEFARLHAGTDTTALRGLVDEARDETARGGKPHARRALYRVVHRLVTTQS